jgi:uncharacterized protein (DUF362 family)/Pyruvate/2-oxoacid:ferredoxin oxidoreductase delta subunit
MNSRVAIVKCKSYFPDTLQGSLEQALGLLGGISVFIRPQSKVLVKPNLLMACPPQAGITTHPEVLRAVIRALKKIGCKIFVGDAPSVWGGQIENVEQVYEETGTRAVCAQEGVELVKFEKKIWLGEFALAHWLKECDYLVNVPKFKTHEYTLLTAAVKNLFGLVCGTHKTDLHFKYFKAEQFSKMLVDICQQAKPALTVVDAVVSMEADGPATSGKLRNTGLILAGADCIAIDTLLAAIMGLKPQDVLTNREGALRGLGCAEIEKIEILGEKLESVRGRPFVLPATALQYKLPLALVKVVKKMIKYYPYIQQDKCVRCQACMRACPKKIISIKKNKTAIYYPKCIACFCCQEVCPSAAIKVQRSLFARLIGL